MDLAQKSSFFTMDVTTDIAFGHTWGCLTKDDDVDKWFGSNERFLPAAIMFSTIPWQAKFFSIPIIGRMVLPSDKDPVGSERALGVIKDVVRQRLATDDHEKKQDMMASFFRHGVTETEAVTEAVTEASLQIIAGGDTAATAIRATLLHVMTCPQVYQRIQAEVDSTSVANCIISDEQARKLPYLQAVIKEGCRICLRP